MSVSDDLKHVWDIQDVIDNFLENIDGYIAAKEDVQRLADIQAEMDKLDADTKYHYDDRHEELKSEVAKKKAEAPKR